MKTEKVLLSPRLFLLFHKFPFYYYFYKKNILSFFLYNETRRNCNEIHL